MTIIRLENPSDAAEVEALLRACFPGRRDDEMNEWTLVENIRANGDVERGLALVAEVDDHVVGYALFSNATLGQARVAALAPLAVKPEFQRQGIGALLVERGIEIAQSKGFDCTAVLGGPYYTRFGYKPVPSGVTLADGLDEHLYLIDLRDPEQENPPFSGTLRYCSAFYDENGRLL